MRSITQAHKIQRVHEGRAGGEHAHAAAGLETVLSSHELTLDMTNDCCERERERRHRNHGLRRGMA